MSIILWLNKNVLEQYNEIALNCNRKLSTDTYYNRNKP